MPNQAKACNIEKVVRLPNKESTIEKVVQAKACNIEKKVAIMPNKAKACNTEKVVLLANKACNIGKVVRLPKHDPRFHHRNDGSIAKQRLHLTQVLLYAIHFVHVSVGILSIVPLVALHEYVTSPPAELAPGSHCTEQVSPGLMFVPGWQVSPTMNWPRLSGTRHPEGGRIGSGAQHASAVHPAGSEQAVPDWALSPIGQA